MQIHRFDADIHRFTPARHLPRTSGEQDGTGIQSSSTTSNASPVKTESMDARWADFAGLLQNLSAKRAKVIQAAREKVANGEFSTRRAAIQLAATHLHSEFFNRPEISSR